MEAPQNIEVTENPIFTTWPDDFGILCFVSKKHSSQTIEETRELFAEIKKISQGQKKCILMDLSNFQMPGKKSHEYGAAELPHMATAIAFLSRSTAGAFCGQCLFFSLETTLSNKNVHSRGGSKTVAQKLFGI